MPDPLVSLFLDAVRVDAQSLHERPMAEFISNALGGLPLDILEDDTAPKFGGSCGNLLCVPHGFDSTKPAIALLAHMDTPRSTAHVRPMITDGRITSDGTTALGVDNRAGTSILVQALRSALSSGMRGNFLVVFTVAEELGPYGSRYLDLSPYNIKMCFVFDCSRRPGVFIRSAVGCSLYRATFKGRAAHAAVAPEKGINAIHLAARALADIRIGRHSPTMTSNIGKIVGGGATNVVPDQCIVEGEVREFDPDLINQHLAMLEAHFRRVANDNGGGLEFSTSVDFSPFRLKLDDPIVRTTVEVLQQVGAKPEPIEYLGGSDANELNAKGIPAVNLGIGAQNPHGNDEFILIEDLHQSLKIALALMERSQQLS
jgi:tripeptide aminopeptidase